MKPTPLWRQRPNPGKRNFAFASLLGFAQNTFVLVYLQANAWNAINNRSDCGNCASITNCVNTTIERLGVCGCGQTEVRENGGLERHHRAT
jgi:positive regulator of sigma E activity